MICGFCHIDAARTTFTLTPPDNDLISVCDACSLSIPKFSRCSSTSFAVRVFDLQAPPLQPPFHHDVEPTF